MKRILSLFLGSTLLVFVGCGKSCAKQNTTVAAETSEATEFTVKDPVASVDGEKISGVEFKNNFLRTKTRFEKVGRTIPASLEGRIKQSIFQQMVEDILIRKEAANVTISVTDKEKNEELAAYQERMGGKEAFENFLKELDVTQEEVTKSIEGNLLRKKLLDKKSGKVTPTAKEIKDYYANNKDRFKKSEEVLASHILFKFDKDITEEAKKEKLAQAKKVLAEAKKKDANFVELAKKHSEGPTAANGGDLGWFAKGRMIKEFEEAAFNSKKGSVTGPVETVFGYHVIQIRDKKPAFQKTFEQAKAEIKESLTLSEKSKRTQAALASLKEKAEIVIFEPSLKEAPPEEKAEAATPKS